MRELTSEELNTVAGGCRRRYRRKCRRWWRWCCNPCGWTSNGNGNDNGREPN